MATYYSDKLLAQLAAYKTTQLPDTPGGTWVHEGEDTPCAHILPTERYQTNILPTIRDEFWRWFEAQRPTLKLHPFFHHLSSSQAMSFNLFFPMVTGGSVDKRLLKALGIAQASACQGWFEKVLHPEENTSFDFYIESAAGRKIFFELKLAEGDFGTCADDERHRQKLEREYQPHLTEHVDGKWLEPKTFFDNYQVMRNLSYLGRYPDSGVAFIFPKANERLMEAGKTIKQIVSRSLAPRVAILYLEYLVERILEAVADDEPLRRHYLAFRDKYVCL